MSTAQAQYSLAILDDYHNIAVPYFSHIPNLSITSYPDTLHPTQSPPDHDALIARLKPHHIISTMRERTPLPASILNNLPDLRLLLTTGTRNLSIDTPATITNNITYAGTVPPLPSSPTARAAKSRYSNTNEHTFALLLSLAKNTPTDDHNIKTNSHGGWATSFTTSLAGKTIGLLGLGRLGSQAAITASLGFGMRVLAWSPNLTQSRADEVASTVGLAPGTFTVVADKSTLFRDSDVISIHLVLSPRSQHIISAADLALMKSDALLINTSRGPLVDETALLQVLRAGKIGGAALDVFDTEPLPRESEWRDTEWGRGGRARVVLSPHMGYADRETMGDWYRQQGENVERWLRGEEVRERIGDWGSGGSAREAKA